MTEQLLPFAQQEYLETGKEIGAPLVKTTSILDFYPTREAAQLFSERVAADSEYLGTLTNENVWRGFFRFNYGIGEIAPALIVDLQALLAGWREVLSGSNMLREETFESGKIKMSDDAITYDDISADNIIFCDGAASTKNKWFSPLPWSDDKGEALIVSIPGLPGEYIYKQGLSIVPWKDGLFWVGASHDWKSAQAGTTTAFRNATTELLNYWLKLPFTVEDHISALRPANFDRRPFVGFHPIASRVGIFNGMGGKGISMAPWFAKQFASHITNGTPLPPEVDVARYKKMLERSLA